MKKIMAMISNELWRNELRCKYIEVFSGKKNHSQEKELKKKNNVLIQI